MSYYLFFRFYLSLSHYLVSWDTEVTLT